MNYSYNLDATAGAGYFLAGFVALMLAIVAVVIVGFVFWVMMLIDVVRREFPAGSNDKVLWLVIMIIFGVIGAIVYYFLGRQHGTLPVAAMPTRVSEAEKSVLQASESVPRELAVSAGSTATHGSDTEIVSATKSQSRKRSPTKMSKKKSVK